MKKIFRILCAVMALLTVLTFAISCGGEGSNSTTTTTVTTTASTTTTTTQMPEDKPDDPNKGDNEKPIPDDGRIYEPTVEVPADGKITTAEQLHAVLVKGDPSKNYTVEAESLDMSKYGWSGMFDYKGIFDFGSCTITGAKDSLFISVNGGTVKNLTIADSTYVYDDEMAANDFSATDNVTLGNKIYSPVIRTATDITVSNIVIESSVTIEASIYDTDSHHGGILGDTVGSFVVIENCVFKGTYVTDSMLVNLGGIVGKMYSNDQSVVKLDEPESSTNRIVNCVSYGKIENKCEGYDSKVAGIVGYAENVAIIGCANYGEVTSADDGQTAGVAGYAGGAIYVKNCLNTAKISGADAVGGICGYSNGEVRHFENCVNIGKIVGTERVGGLVGMMKNRETLTNCFNLSSAYANFSIDAEKNPIVPSNSSTHGALTITNCDNVDSVSNILALINASAPGVFVADGELIKLA